MDSTVDIVGELLDGVGHLSGQTFHLLAGGNAPDPTGLAAGFAPELAALAAGETAPNEMYQAWAENGEPLYGIPVNTAEGPQLLVTAPSAPDAPPIDREQSLRSLLGSARHLIETREESANETGKLAEELNQAYEDLYLFSRIATQIRSLTFSEQMLQDLLEETCEAMRVELAAARFDPKNETNVHVARAELGDAVPDPEQFLADLVMDMPRHAPSFARGCHIINCSTEIPRFAALNPEPFRALAVSINGAERQYGWLVLVSFNMEALFQRGEYRLLRTMAEQLALVLANTELYRDLEISVINLVKSLVMAIEAKDVYTRGHSERVCRLSMLTAEALALDAGQRADLQWASMLHDLGKIGTPEAILNKPGRLSGVEYDNIKMHPAKGAEILKPISQLANALPAIRHHHEQYGGGGYPAGLCGEDIPLLARIIAVADTYDAITSNRAYRPARTHQDAIRVLREGAGSQFDPRVVDAFQRVVTSRAATEPQNTTDPAQGRLPQRTGRTNDNRRDQEHRRHHNMS